MLLNQQSKVCQILKSASNWRLSILDELNERDSVWGLFGHNNTSSKFEIEMELKVWLVVICYRASVDYVAGGSAQNTVRILQRLLGTKSNCYVLGKIARDDAGTILQDLLRQDGVGTR